MESLDQITRALGALRALWRLQRGSKTVAAVARWQHSGAVIDLSRADAYQVILNLSGGQIVDLPELMGARLNIRAGSVGINSPEKGGLITVNGQADTLQILVSRDLIRSAPDHSTAASPALSTSKPQLHAAAVQALVALENGTDVDRSQLERIVLETATHLVPPSLVPARMSKGGLSPAARRCVCAVYDDWFADSAKPLPPGERFGERSGSKPFLFHSILPSNRRRDAARPVACCARRSRFGATASDRGSHQLDLRCDMLLLSFSLRQHLQEPDGRYARSLSPCGSLSAIGWHCNVNSASF
jgi:hypothetical protein